jgi:pimeloyl-ACP methyl ester carboxylesterase
MHFVTCGSGVPVLFIHGMPTSNRLWNEVIQHLCGSFRCFAVDLPGMGATAIRPYDADFLRSLAEQIDQIRIENNIDKWHVVGHDAGSAVAVHYARYFPDHVACLALLAPALFPDLKPFFLLEALRTPIIGELLAPFIGQVFWRIAMRRALGHSIQSGRILQEFRKPFAGFAGPWNFMRVLRWGKPSFVLAEVPGFLPSLLMPTLIFHGSLDPAIPEAFARRAADLMPNASLVTLESGHFIPLSQPGPVASRLAGFFIEYSTTHSEMQRPHYSPDFAV